MAIEDAFLADHGFGALEDHIAMIGQPANYHEHFSKGIQEATGSNHDQDWQSRTKASFNFMNLISIIVSDNWCF